LKGVFDRLESDGVVERGQLIDEMRNDINVVRMLHVQANYLAALDKVQTLDAVLSLVY